MMKLQQSKSSNFENLEKHLNLNKPIYNTNLDHLISKLHLVIVESCIGKWHEVKNKEEKVPR